MDTRVWQNMGATVSCFFTENTFPVGSQPPCSCCQRLIFHVIVDPVQVLRDSGVYSRIPWFATLVAERYDTDLYPPAFLLQHQRTTGISLKPIMDGFNSAAGGLTLVSFCTWQASLPPSFSPAQMKSSLIGWKYVRSQSLLFHTGRSTCLCTVLSLPPGGKWNNDATIKHYF